MVFIYLYIIRKTAGARRLVEAHYGRIDPDEWESLPDAPICLEDALKVSLHLLAAHVHISRVFLMVVKLPQVCKNLFLIINTLVVPKNQLFNFMNFFSTDPEFDLALG